MTATRNSGAAYFWNGLIADWEATSDLEVALEFTPEGGHTLEWFQNLNTATHGDILSLTGSPGLLVTAMCSFENDHADIAREYYFSTTLTPWLVRADSAQELWDQSSLVKTDDVWVFGSFSADAGLFQMVGVDQQGRIVDRRTAVFPHSANLHLPLDIGGVYHLSNEQKVSLWSSSEESGGLQSLVVQSFCYEYQTPVTGNFVLQLASGDMYRLLGVDNTNHMDANQYVVDAIRRALARSNFCERSGSQTNFHEYFKHVGKYLRSYHTTQILALVQWGCNHGWQHMGFVRGAILRSCRCNITSR
jgi:hypothetical protein